MFSKSAWSGALGMALLLQHSAGAAQNNADEPVPVKVEASSAAAPARTEASTERDQRPSAKATRAALAFYLKGAKAVYHKDYEAAERSLASAVELDPENETYALAFLFLHETRLTRTVQAAAKARLLGQTDRAHALLAEGFALDPKNPIVTQHLRQSQSVEQGQDMKGPAVASHLAAPVEFAPQPDTRSFHLHGDIRDILRSVYSAFGIAVVLDDSVHGGRPVTFDVDNVDFERATAILAKMSETCAIAVQPTTALIAKDTEEFREREVPLVQQTLYLPGQHGKELTELAGIARNVFGLKQVATGIQSGALVLRGEEGDLKILDAIYADLLENQTDVLLDVKLYELDRSNTRNIGFSLPSSASAIDVSKAATSLISANQTLINDSISSGELTLSGSTYNQELQEVEFLVAAGVSGSSEFTNILGTLGSYQGVPIAGISVGSGTFNLLLSSTDVRTLDSIQLRASNAEAATFRVGSRYPVLTALTTASSSSAVASALAAAGASSAVIAEYGGTTTTATVPQIQFEDLGMTLNITPRVEGDNKVQLALDFKIESIAGTGVSGIPILNNHALTSTVTVQGGQTTMLATVLSTNDTKLLDGVPDLNELPGFEGTNQDTDGTSTELLVTVTPHIVHTSGMRVVDRTFVLPRSQTAAAAPLADE